MRLSNSSFNKGCFDSALALLLPFFLPSGDEPDDVFLFRLFAAVEGLIPLSPSPTKLSLSPISLSLGEVVSLELSLSPGL